MLLPLEGCLHESDGVSTTIFVTCAPFPDISEGEIVSYNFSGSDGHMSTHNFIGLKAGEFLYSSSEGIENTYSIEEVIENAEPFCLQPALAPTQHELLFMFGIWAPELGVMNAVMEPAPDQTAEMTEADEVRDCTYTDVSVPAGNFQTYTCTYRNSEGVFLFAESNSEDSNKPFSGLVKYVYGTDDHKFTAELIEWNGL